ncbi:putative transposase [Paraburkholderia xenovorans LB400]|nr:putative transposase [Paraburkholderia xenovorans LB400]
MATLAEALEQAAILSDVTPGVAVVDRSYKGVAIDGVKSTTRACGAASHAHYVQ